MIPNRDVVILLVICFVTVFISFNLTNQVSVNRHHSVNTLLYESEVNFENIIEIEIKRNDLLLTFEQIGGVWWQQKPFEIRMSSPSMISIVKAVEGVKVLGEISSSSDSEVLGFGDEANYIMVSDGINKDVIFLGRKTLGGRAYAKYGNRKIVFIDQSLHRGVIDYDYRRWRDVRVFPEFSIDGNRVERIVDGNRLLIERNNGVWKMSEPVSTHIDYEMYSEWVGRIAAMRVGSFVFDEPTDLAMFGLHNPSATFSVTDRNGKQVRLWIGGRVSSVSQDRYVMHENNPVVFRMKWEELSKLFPLPEMFVDATGSAVSRFDVKQITIRSTGNEIKYVRDLERWVDINGVQANEEQIDALLTWLLEIKPPSISIGKYPRETEVATVTLDGYDLLPIDTVRIALDESGKWILENGDNVLRLHPSDAGKVLTPLLIN
ncbi:MAG: DUF4340 domain-containing protein [Phycisphaerales bacterium]|jgi:hypothetical protein|nr:DUF4340 domain-containing protein [Phycisphaerales bacterium]